MANFNSKQLINELNKQLFYNQVNFQGEQIYLLEINGNLRYKTKHLTFPFYLFVEALYSDENL